MRDSLQKSVMGTVKDNPEVESEREKSRWPGGNDRTETEQKRSTW
jgi:hypothetical protein